ncbi:MAG TPA: hypothetical protein VH082_14960 [Rudaea sp.]|jgi:hypothetical protein|nr:hypothetical protein [Rudaea sp.]
MFRLVAFAFVLSLTAPVFAAQKNPMFDMSVVGEVQIAPDGSVSDYRLQSKLSPVIAELVDRGVRAWHFEPVLVDGKPVVAKTAMRLTLKGVPVDDDNYRIEVANVIFGEPHVSAGMKAPRYPPYASASRVGAKVLLYLKIDDDGNVVEVEPYQTSLDVRTHSEAEAQSYRKQFESVSVRAAQDWHFDVTETINGKKLGGIVMVPFVFSMKGGGHEVRDGQWKAYVPGPIHDAPLGREAKIADGAKFADLGEGQAQSLNSRFKLRDDVIGKPL